MYCSGAPFLIMHGSVGGLLANFISRYGHLARAHKRKSGGETTTTIAGHAVDA
jgi:hypothetical protein